MTATLNPWTRAVHALLQARELGQGQPEGLTYQELVAKLGPPPFDAALARRMLRRMVHRGWLSSEREAGVARKGGCQVRLRFAAAAALPDGRPRAAAGRYFDGLVRASSVFELARIVGGRQGGAR